MKRFEYIKEASPFGSLRQIPEMENPEESGKGFSYHGAFVAAQDAYVRELLRMPLYPLSTQPSNEWIQRKEYEEGVDFTFHNRYTKTPSGNWISGIGPVAIPIEKKGHDLVASQNHPLQKKMDEYFKNVTGEELIAYFEGLGYKFIPIQNHPQPESSVATLACTEGNSIEQEINLLTVIEKADDFLDRLFARVPLPDPYYQQGRELQVIIEKFKNSLGSQRKVRRDHDGVLLESVKSLRESGLTIREIAKAMGYKHPGSISHLLNKLDAAQERDATDDHSSKSAGSQKPPGK